MDCTAAQFIAIQARRACIEALGVGVDITNERLAVSRNAFYWEFWKTQYARLGYHDIYMRCTITNYE